MATAEVKKSIDRFKLKLQIFITTFLLIIIFGYLVSFIPIDKFGIKVESNLLEGIYKFATSGVLSILLRKLLFGTDPLAAGKSKESVFFRSLYPSILIQEKFGVDKGAADKLWFDFFNAWSKPNSNHYSHWQTVFERTYMCRLIYYLSKVMVS